MTGNSLFYRKLSMTVFSTVGRRMNVCLFVRFSQSFPLITSQQNRRSCGVTPQKHASWMDDVINCDIPCF